MAKNKVHYHKRDSATLSLCNIKHKGHVAKNWKEVTCKRCLKLKKPPKKRGPKTKWKDEYLDVIFDLRLGGASERAIAQSLGIKRETLWAWKKANPKITNVLQEAEEERLNKVEHSLYERAIGYEHKETKMFCYKGSIVSEDTIKRYPPETAAIQYYLNNRNPEKWKKETTSLDDLMKDGKITIGFTKGD